MMNDFFNVDRASGLCTRCKKVNTTCKYEGQYMCSSCSNKQYIQDVSLGNIEIFKVRLKNYQPGTVHEIRAILARNKINPAQKEA